MESSERHAAVRFHRYRESLFGGCSNLKSITLPDSVTSIGPGAFSSSGLERITLPAGVTSIEEGVFRDCGSLVEISIPSGVTSIGNYAFNGCTLLAGITLPSGITSIGEGTFANCGSLHSLTIPDSVTSIGNFAFVISGLYSLTIPAGVTSIGGDIFYNCSGLNAVYFQGNAPTVGTSYYGLFQGTPSGLKVYYPYGASGWTNPWNGRETITRCTVTYDSRGGSAVENTVADINSVIAEPAAPDKENDSFKGWYKEATLETPWNFDNDTVTENITLYAKWNTLPNRHEGIPAAAEAEVMAGTSYTLDLAAIFEDEDADDTLTYKVSVNGAPDIGANADYSYTPESAGQTTLVFKANDGTVDSDDTYTVTLMAKGPTLESIAITTPATKLVYTVGEELDISGLVVTGTYSDSSTKTEPITEANISGFDSSAPAENQVLTITVGSKTAAYTITINTAPPVVNTGTVSGTVTDGTNPIAGANVSLTVSESVYSATTIADGSYTILNVPAGTGYTVTATESGYTSGSATNVNVTADTTTQNVNITLTAIPVTYTVTFNKNSGDMEANPTTKTVDSGGNVGTLPTPPTRSGYTFNGWNTEANGSGTAFTANTAVTSSITVYAQWTANNSAGGGGRSSTPVVTPPAETPKTETTVSGNTSTVTTTATAITDSNGKASATVTQAQVSDAISKAVAEAEKQGEGMTARVEIKVDAPANATTVETRIPKEAVDLASEGRIESLTVSSPVASITFGNKALSTISGEASGDVKITASKVEASSLSSEAQQSVGDRPVFNFSVTSGDRTISQFGGNVSVSVPYTPKAGEDLNAIIVYCIDSDGALKTVRGTYDTETGTVDFVTDHFSKYAVGYNKVTFKDVSSDAWYYDAIGFIAARGITTGTGSGNYSPEARLTRGEFIVMMMRSYGIEPDTDLTNNFADAGNTCYTGYLAAAKRLGISAGVGNNMFAPAKQITRQEMFTLMYNALKVIGELPGGTPGKSLSDFSDAGEIAAWAKDAMTLFVETGTIGGSGGKLTPTDTTTRAQLAQVLYNLLSK